MFGFRVVSSHSTVLVITGSAAEPLQTWLQLREVVGARDRRHRDAGEAESPGPWFGSAANGSS